ncbi:DUF6048 family protein [Aquimarina sp. RZ0]|uniref:DUF6048 family protein n=1 Tax=Aquimarina sp. RZ0 TaxID=2607730 RepID=UPI0011F29ABC|nr:DUF6048 family protein [Aquimarina sp. RZ0]KAA1246974.1 hypothetical protein F0000_05815 [Aquimarina sp. RZ0]
MRQMRTYLFFISLLISGTILSQEEDKTVAARDTLPPAEKYGLRLGIDINRIIRTAINDDYSGFEIIGDYRFYKDFYIAAEIGNESLVRDEENINVEGSGTYGRFGIDYNSYDNWYGMQNSVYAGLRYGFSSFDQTLSDYRVFTGTDFFPDEIRTDERKSNGLTAGWVELVLGLKVETLKNLYLGANISIRRLVNEKDPEGFENLFIPGFGRTNDFSLFGVGYNYSISYLIPFVKKKR